MKVRTIVSTLLLAGTLASGAAQATYSAIDLGWGTNAYDLNDSGHVVGYSYALDGTYPRAFLYFNGAMTDIGRPGSYASVAYGINNASEVVGHSVGGSQRAFYYFNGVWQDLGALAPGAATASTAHKINDFGQIVGESGAIPYVGSNYHGVLWAAGTMTDIGYIATPGRTSATDINNAGQIVGNTSVPDANHGYVYLNGVMTDLGTLPGGNGSTAVAINNAGLIVGNSYVVTPHGHEQHAFLYRNGVMEDLGAFDGLTLDTSAYDINEAGQIVGMSSGLAFLYEHGAMLDINTMLANSLGTTLTYAMGINESGQIISYAQNGHSYLLTPLANTVPEPETYTMLLAGLGLLGFLMRRRKQKFA